MSTHEIPEDPLSKVGQYSGMIYWINAPSGLSLDLKNLRDHLDDRILKQDISDQIDESTKIPDVFKDNGNVIRKTSVSGAKITTSRVGEVIWADVQMDSTNTVSYRGQKILTMDASEAELIIFEHQNITYAIVVARRDVAESVADIIRKEYSQIGDLINGTRLEDKALREIREDLNADLIDTILSEFPDEDLTNVEYSGSGFEDHRDYTTHQSRGVTQNYMFQTDDLVADDHKTIRIANDGLVRIYNNTQLEIYLQLLTDYILPRVHRDSSGSAALDTFDKRDQHPIFTEEV